MSAEQAAPQPAARPPRRCRRRAIDPGSPRPSQLLGTFFAAGLLFIAAAALAGVAYALSGSVSPPPLRDSPPTTAPMRARL
jgi:hypothetical protein